MDDQVRQIAGRLRELREIAGVTVESLAREVGVTGDELRHYESGAVDIPVSVLSRAAHRFGAELSSLITGEEPRLHVYQVTRAGRGPGVQRRSDYAYQSLASNFAGKRMEPFLITVPVHTAGEPVPLNSHPGQEFQYVLEGTLRVLVGGHEVALAPGDSLYFDASHPHGLSASGGSPVRLLAVIL
jgi:quercetin dioxygenase-like cupin family protein/DNA-binding XRE family transcriptional regulator